MNNWGRESSRSEQDRSGECGLNKIGPAISTFTCLFYNCIWKRHMRHTAFNSSYKADLEKIVGVVK